MPECKPARFRRILAWIVDFALCGLLPYCALGIPELLGVPSLLMLPLGIVATIGWLAAIAPILNDLVPRRNCRGSCRFWGFDV